jgi:hypothetical protein
MTKFIVSPNPSSNFSNSSCLANKKEPDHSGLEPGQTLTAALGGFVQVCSTILLPQDTLYVVPFCPESSSQIIAPPGSSATDLEALDLADGGPLTPAPYPQKQHRGRRNARWSGRGRVERGGRKEGRNVPGMGASLFFSPFQPEAARGPWCCGSELRVKSPLTKIGMCSLMGSNSSSASP